tara:strand:- start:40 stop:672 length:633 start_codon:yes stop_codon:yes gene_type:complete
MPDYSNGIIYTIESRASIYVGSTVNFASRKNQHIKSITDENSKQYNFKLYKTIRENEGEYDIQPYSQFPCKSKMELTIEEERVRKLLKADMNMRRCGTCATKSEYYYKYRDEINNNRQQHYQRNKQHIIEHVKEYRLNNLEKIKETKRKNYQRNKEAISAKHKLYRDNNKDKIAERKKLKMTCGCGTTCRVEDIARHRRSIKHSTWEKNK